MKLLIFTISILFIFSNSGFADDEMRHAELLIKNRMTNGNLQVKIYPIGMIFGSGTVTNQYFIYTPKAQEDDHPPDMEYITGATSHILIPYIPGTPTNENTFYRIDQDGVSSSGWCSTTVGYGKYRIDIYLLDESNLENTELIRSFTMDWSDSDYPNSWTGGVTEDLKIYVLSPTDIRFHWGGGATEPFENHIYDFHELSIMNNELKIWYQYHKDYEGIPYVNQKVPNKNNFRTTNLDNNLYLNSWPINGLNFSNPGSPSIHITPGILNVNLEIQNTHHAKINTSIPFRVEEEAKLKLQNSSDYNNNSRLIVENNANCYINSSASLEVGNYGNVLIENGGKLWLENNSNSTLNNYATITVNSGGNLYNCGANFLNSSNTAIKINFGGNYYVGYQNCLQGITNEFNQNSYFLLDGGTIYVSDNSTLLFRGSNTTFETKNGSSVILGQNASIEFENGARLIANGTTFTSSSGTWNGISLTNPKASIINGCIFNEAEKPLSIINTSSYYANLKHHITNNIFNLPQNNSVSCFTGRNIFKINFQNNELNGHTSNTNDRGIFFYNAISPSTPSESPEFESYDLKFVQNEFKNLSIGAMFINSASALADINFLNNKYTGSKSSMVYGLNAIKTKGNFKNNKFLYNQGSNDYHYDYGMIFNLSNPDLYNNMIRSEGASLPLAAAHPKMAPYTNTNGHFVWNSGANDIYSRNSDNVKILSASYSFTDRGNNAFTSDNYHFSGYLVEGIQESLEARNYYSRGNCWYPNGSAVVNITTPGVTFHYLPTSTFCAQLPVVYDVLINDLGDGVYDSIIVSVPDSLEELESDELYYAQAMDLVNSANYYNASQNLMWLIDDCEESELRFYALYDLYSFYGYMDTSSNPGISYGLWEELYDYLLLKIEQYVEDYDFQDIAYNIAIMCQINMEEYEDAMTKYQGIILNHPDPIQRLIASWDYDALVDLLDTANYGEGGSMKNLPDYNESIFAFPGKNFDDLKPVEKVIHKNYRERRIEGNRKSEEKITSMLKDEPNNSKIIAER